MQNTDIGDVEQNRDKENVKSYNENVIENMIDYVIAKFRENMDLEIVEKNVGLEIVEKNMGLESGKAHGTPEYVEEDEDTENVRQKMGLVTQSKKMGLVTPNKKEDVEIQYIPRRSITEQ